MINVVSTDPVHYCHHDSDNTAVEAESWDEADRIETDSDMAGCLVVQQISVPTEA